MVTESVRTEIFVAGHVSFLFLDEFLFTLDFLRRGRVWRRRNNGMPTSQCNFITDLEVGCLWCGVVSL